ncbi:DUF4836 family protein [Metapseudomonas otitidis]|uniref:DUF4836 family protein n=1 Tax=Metapseudomonas otitidis TaxID=319939 RepID=UPI002096D39B|nr:DUF4836 family protein [Pseudomonas otitidis]MCO7556183.1 DUF4836 family protein [Pseudomonas otitidis]
MNINPFDPKPWALLSRARWHGWAFFHSRELSGIEAEAIRQRALRAISRQLAQMTEQVLLSAIEGGECSAPSPGIRFDATIYMFTEDQLAALVQSVRDGEGEEAMKVLNRQGPIDTTPLNGTPSLES